MGPTRYDLSTDVDQIAAAAHGNSVRGRLWGAAVACWIFGLTFWMVRGTLHLPWISDDFNHLQLIAEIRAGLRPGWDLITYPYHGQTLILLRSIFWLGTLQTAMDPALVRLVIAITHACGAAGCAFLCYRWTGSKFAAWFAGTLYAGAAGFIGQTIWGPSNAIFLMAGLFLIFAIIPLTVKWVEPQSRLAMSLTMVVLAALSLNGAALAAVGLALFAVRKNGRAIKTVLVYGATAVMLLAAAAWNASVHPGEAPVLSAGGIPAGLWLIFTAPLRFLWSLTPFPTRGFRTVAACAVLPWIVLIVSWFLVDQKRRRILLAVWLPAVLLALLVGAARSQDGPGFLYTNDRYYYWFLFPLTVHVALLLPQSVLARAATAVLLVLALAGSRQQYLAGVPRKQFDTISQTTAKGRLLARIVSSHVGEAGDLGPLILADGTVPLNDIYLGKPSLAWVIYSEFPKGIPGMQMVKGGLDPAGTAIENGILNEWAERAGLAGPPACVERGSLTVQRPSWVDFRKNAQEGAVISGFSWWEGNFRWMERRASVRVKPAAGNLAIIAYAPLDRLRQRWPALQGISLKVKLDGKRAGEFMVRDAGIQEYGLTGHPSTGPAAEVELSSDFTWKARDLDPESFDERELSVAILAVGFRGSEADDRKPSASLKQNNYCQTTLEP